MTRSSMNRSIAIGVIVTAVVIIGVLVWQRSGPLVPTHRQAFRFESHPHALKIEAKRPIVAAAANGGLYLLSAENSGLMLRMSHDGGEHWMSPTTLSTPASTVTTSAENAPQL